MACWPLTCDLCSWRCRWLLLERQKGNAGVCSCFSEIDSEASTVGNLQLLGYRYDSYLPMIPSDPPPFSKIKGAWHVVFCVLDDRLLPPAFNYSCWSPVSPQLRRLEHTHTDKELCKCMCHVLLAMMFGVLCCGMVTGSFSFKYSTQRLLLQIKAEAFHFFWC